MQRDGEGAELLVGAGVLRQGEDAVAAVDHDRLFGHEVHAVEHGVDHEDVELLVGGDGQVEVVLQVQLDRPPRPGAVLVVHFIHRGPDPLDVGGVFGDVLAAGLEQGQEGDPLGQLGMVLEQQVVGQETPDDVLARVGAVHPEEQMVAASSGQFPFLVEDRRRLRHRLEHRWVDRDRIPAGPYDPAVDDHLHGGEVYGETEQLLAAEQEVPGVALGVETHHVVAEQPAEQGVAHRGRQHPPRVGLRPGDVDEMVKDGAGAAESNLAGQEVEVVIVDHHDRLTAGGVHLLGDDLGEATVHGGVARLEGVGLPPGDVRRRVQVVQVVLDEPQQRVGNNGVEGVLGIRVEGHQSHSEPVVAQFGQVLPAG